MPCPPPGPARWTRAAWARGRGRSALGGRGGSARPLGGCRQSLGGWTVGVLVQSNYGGVLQILGAPVGQILGQHYLRRNWSRTGSRRRTFQEA